MSLIRRLANTNDHPVFDNDFSNWSVLRFGTSGADTMRGGIGRDTFLASNGNDTYIGNGGVDKFYGGEGTDTVDYSTISARPTTAAGFNGVIVDLASGVGGEVDEASDTFSSIENLTGSNFNDALFGDNNANVILGLAGNDSIMGGAGADTLDGGEQTGDSDTLLYATSNAGVTVDLRTGSASGGHATGDIIRGFENVEGSQFSDTLTGDAGDNVIQGGSGVRDVLNGGLGSDTVSYSNSAGAVTVNLGNDTASGGDATGDVISSFENVTGSRNGDTLTGSFRDNRFEGLGGADVMTGGDGRDTFVFDTHQNTGHDRITDYNVLQDTLRFDVDDFDVEPIVSFADGSDEWHVDITLDFGNGTVTLEDVHALDVLAVRWEFV